MSARAGIARIGSSLFAFTLFGCAYVNPYVRVSDETSVGVVSPKLPQVAGSVTFLDLSIAAAEKKRDEVGKTHRLLDLVSFGLATGAAVSPIYKAHRDLSSGLGLGAGAVYAANSLFLSADRITLYSTAASSLACLRNKALILSGAVSAAYGSGESQGLTASYNSAKQSEIYQCARPEAQDAIYAAYRAADQSANRAVNADAMAAAKLRQAGVAVISTLNTELDKRSPSPEAILAASKAIPLGAGVTTQTATPSAKKERDEGAQKDRACTDAERQSGDEMKSQLVAEFQKTKKDLDTAFDALESLDTVCTFVIPAIADLAVSQESVVLMKDVEIHVRVSGGRPPYTSSWDTDPQKYGVILTQAAPDTFVLKGAEIAEDKTLKLEIRDSSAAGRSKTIAVNAKKAAEQKPTTKPQK